MADIAPLIGTWAMVYWTRTTLATGEVTDAMGPDPVGYLSYQADGRMTALVFRRDRARAAGPVATDAEKAHLLDTMLAYTATYTLEDDRVVHHVERAWKPEWEIDLVRPCVLEGDILRITGAPGLDPQTGQEVVFSLEFRRCTPA